MITARPESLLTRTEQFLIAITIPAVAILARVVIALLSATLNGHSVRIELLAVSITVAMFAPFPVAVSAMVRAVAMRSRIRELAVLVIFSVLGAVTSYLWVWILWVPDWEGFFVLGWIYFRLYAPATGVFLSLTAYFITAIHQRRTAIAEDARRFEAETESARRARQSIERQTTPALIVAALQTVASRAISDPVRAERLLLRLARHQRLLLHTAAADFEDELRRAATAIALIRPDVRVAVRGSGSKPGMAAGHRFLTQFQQGLLNGPAVTMTVETTPLPGDITVRFQTTDSGELPPRLRQAFADSVTSADDSSMTVALQYDVAPPPVVEENAPIPAPSLPVVYPLIAYLIAAFLFDLSGIHWEQSFWNGTIMTLVSAALWLLAGPILSRIVRATVVFRLPVAIALALAGVMTSALFVTGVAAAVLASISADSIKELVECNLSIMAWRNSLPALVIGANALMSAYGEVMAAARAAAARARNEAVRAETRALEDRFHPHFLFNSLNSIAAFIREDRAAAVRMCLQLSGLVERTVAFAGDRWWAVDHELDLITEYLSIQRIRFGDRLEIEHWDIPPDVRRKSIPRLILQPLLENIFKHAVAASARPIHAGLTIRKYRRGIEIFLWNSIAGLAEPLGISETPRTGRGLAFVSGRVHDARGTLSIDDNAAGGRFAIRCYIPSPL